MSGGKSAEQADTLRVYYKQRAAEYEAIYEKPERQNDLRALAVLLEEALRGKRVLELACGTGYWTEKIAPAVESITAVDVNPETLEIAQSKRYPDGKVQFLQGDCYELAVIPGRFDAALAAFWWSHIPKLRLENFLAQVAARLLPGSMIVFVDNRYVAGSSTPISRTDSEGNTYQIRKLRDGSEFEVLKNFPTSDELQTFLGRCSTDVTIRPLDYYWCAIAGGAGEL